MPFVESYHGLDIWEQSGMFTGYSKSGKRIITPRSTPDRIKQLIKGWYCECGAELELRQGANQWACPNRAEDKKGNPLCDVFAMKLSKTNPKRIVKITRVAIAI